MRNISFSQTIFLGLLCALVFCASFFGFAVDKAHAWCAATSGSAAAGWQCTDDGVPISWRRPCVSYSLDVRTQNLGMSDEEIQNAVDGAFAAWNEVDCEGEPLPLEVEPTERRATCKANEFNQEGGNVHTVAFVDDWEMRGLDPGALAVTALTYAVDTGEIIDGDILINTGFEPFGDCGVRNCEEQPEVRADLQNLLTHEVGHFLGMAHSEFEDATMFATTPGRETSKRELSEDDVEGICEVYSEVELIRQCDDFAPFGGLDLNCEDGLPAPDPGSGQTPSSNGDAGCSIGNFSVHRSDLLLGLILIGFVITRMSKLDERLSFQ